MKHLIETAIRKSGIDFRNDHVTSALWFHGWDQQNTEACYANKDILPHTAKEFIAMNTYLIGNDLNDSHFAITFFHELAHATGKKDRLNRIVIRKPYYKLPWLFKNFLFGIEELIAERTAQKLVHYFEIDTMDCRNKSMRYIDTWLVYCHANILLAKWIEKRSDRAMGYILDNWLSEFKNHFFDRKAD